MHKINSLVESTKNLVKHIISKINLYNSEILNIYTKMNNSHNLILLNY